MGRPKIEINYKLAEKLASILCTQSEIAHILEVSSRTLSRDKEFCRLYKKAVDVGKMSLRREQFKLAQAGNASMLIWLGKVYLGQRETVEHEINSSKDIIITQDQAQFFKKDFLEKRSKTPKKKKKE